jgi:hypothetical protein
VHDSGLLPEAAVSLYAIRLTASAKDPSLVGHSRILMLVYPRADEYPMYRITGCTGPYSVWSDPLEALAVVMDLLDEQDRFTVEVVEVLPVGGMPVCIQHMSEWNARGRPCDMVPVGDTF